MDRNTQAKTISPIEVLVALFVLFIWSAVFVSGVVVVLMLMEDPAELAMTAPTPEPIIIIVTATPAATSTSTPTSTATPERVAPIPAVSVPTATFTRVILPTSEPAGDIVPTPTATAIAIPTYARPVQIAMAENGDIVHYVSAGETLSSIAAMYGASVDNLANSNHIQDPAQIQVGQKLLITRASSEAPVRAAVQDVVVRGSNSAPNPEAPPVVVSKLDPPPPAGDPPTRLVIPKIKMDTPVVEVGWHMVSSNGVRYSEWDVADEVAGWHRGSAFPGNVGNTVISGHHNIKGEVFRYVVDLEAGDDVYLYVRGQAYPYTVTEKYILQEKGMSDEVRSQNARWIAKTTDERVTLVTCWPYTNNTHRVIVVARPAWKQN